ncbi:MAG: hypothetical protein AAF449_21450, partial [Myxococcota bacterium]
MMSARTGGFDIPLLVSIGVVVTTAAVGFVFGPSGAVASAVIVAAAVAFLLVARVPLSRSTARAPV